MLEKQLSVPVRLIELVEFALHLIMPSLSHKKVVRNNAPEENDRDGMLHSMPRSPTYRSALVLVHIQHHEVVRVAIGLHARVRRDVVRLPGQTAPSRNAVRLRFLLTITVIVINEPLHARERVRSVPASSSAPRRTPLESCCRTRSPASTPSRHRSTQT